MNKLVAIKIKYQDQTYSDEIPIGASVQNISWNDMYNLKTVLGDINIDEKGSLQYQINNKPDIDKTLTIENKAADAKVVGDKLLDLPVFKGAGRFSVIEGSASLNQALGPYSHAEGYNSKATISYSHAEGSNTQADGICSHAEGGSTQATGNYSHTEGSGTQAIGNYSHAEGYNSKAIGNYSHAEGEITEASGRDSHSEGYHTEALGNYSHAEGGYSIASGGYSHAQGYNTVANHKSQHVFGQCNIEDDSSASSNNKGNYIEIVGNGSINNRSNARTLDWDGNETLMGNLTVNGGNLILNNGNNTYTLTTTALETLLQLALKGQELLALVTET